MSLAAVFAPECEHTLQERRRQLSRQTIRVWPLGSGLWIGSTFTQRLPSLPCTQGSHNFRALRDWRRSQKTLLSSSSWYAHTTVSSYGSGTHVHLYTSLTFLLRTVPNPIQAWNMCVCCIGTDLPRLYWAFHEIIFGKVAWKMVGDFQIKFIIALIVIAVSKNCQLFERLLKNSHAIGKGRCVQISVWPCRVSLEGVGLWLEDIFIV